MSSPAALNPAEPAPQDFPDRLSPMLVKELRQGMRTRAFTFAFILVQGFMVLFMIAGLAESSRPDEMAAMFWTLLEIILFVVIPLRGLAALSSEIRLKTMDLISLTTMSPWRIVAGKWAAVVSQAALLIVAILPYIVLRYFYGGVDLFTELLFLFIGLLGCMVMTAFTVGMSSFPNPLIRSLVTGGIIFVNLFFFLRILFSGISRPSPFGFLDDPWVWFGLIALCVFLIAYFIDMGASRIAPEAYNYSWRKRLVGLVGVLILALLGAFLAEPFFAFAFLLATFTAADALTERVSTVRSVHLPFFRRGFGGNMAHAVFTPGWSSGISFTLLLSATLGAVALSNRSMFDNLPQLFNILVSFTNCLLLPLLFMPLMAKDGDGFFPAFIFLQTAAWAVASFFMGLGNNSDLEILRWIASPLPQVSLLIAADDASAGYPLLFAVNLVVFTFLLYIGWRRSRPYRHLFSRFRRELAPAS